MHQSTRSALLGALTMLATTCVGCKSESPPAEPQGKSKAAPAASARAAQVAATAPNPATAPSTPTPPINPPVDDCNVTPPTTPIAPPLLGSGLPCTVIATAPFDLPNLQRSFDYHSWLVWLALNAPASGGVIGSGPGQGGDAPTVWEDWRNAASVILPGGAEPKPWDAPPEIPAACQKLSKPGRVLHMVGKTPDLLTEAQQPFDTGPLIDQRGNYVRYEILVNRPMFEFIRQNTLYSKAGQKAFGKPIVFPEGSLKKDTTTGTIGAIMIKAAWKIMQAGDPLASFHTNRVLVYTPPSEDPKVEESCVEATAGLVGLHIVHKTHAEPQWVWSSFEHVDNVPDQKDVDAKKLAAHYNFYDPKCAPKACPVNQPPPRPWDPNVQPFPGGYHGQITRVTPITPEAMKLNDAFRGLVTGKVWQHYELVSTQWPTDATSKTDPNGVPAPTFLANTTMETYVQGTVPQSSSSCMACHGNAAATTGADSDFTFILQRAQ